MQPNLAQSTFFHFWLQYRKHGGRLFTTGEFLTVVLCGGLGFWALTSIHPLRPLLNQLLPLALVLAGVLFGIILAILVLTAVFVVEPWIQPLVELDVFPAVLVSFWLPVIAWATTFVGLLGSVIVLHLSAIYWVSLTVGIVDIMLLVWSLVWSLSIAGSLVRLLDLKRVHALPSRPAKSP